MNRVLVALGVSLLLAAPSLAQEAPIDAQTGEPIALPLALELLARSLGYGFIGFGIPETPVRLDFDNVDGRELIASYTSVYGLCHAYNDSAGALTVYPPIEDVCPAVGGTQPVAPSPQETGKDEPEPSQTYRTSDGTTVEVFGSPAGASAAPTAYESYNIRLRLLELNETRALALGLNWDGGIFATAANLVAGVANYNGGALPTPQLDEVVGFLETESLAQRLDDVSLAGFPGEPVRFRSGGDVNVQLVGSGERNISKSFEFGLIVDVTPKRLSENVVRLDYAVQDVDPGNVSDPTLITRNSQDLTGAQPARCGESIVIGQFVRQRNESVGSGLPGLARVPLAGYAAGITNTSDTSRIYVLTLDLECRSVPASLEAAK